MNNTLVYALVFACIMLLYFFLAYLTHFHAIESKKRIHERLIIRSCQNNMQRIASALEAYRNHHGDLPPAYSTDEQGNPLHSWRVLILPYFEDQNILDLYNEIRLDEPWDSEWNSQFHERAPNIFICILSTTFKYDEENGYYSPRNVHYYMLIDENGKLLPDCGILFAERVKAVSHWMDPNHEIRLTDIKDGINSNPGGITSVHEINKHFGLFGQHEKGANICTFDFEVKWVPETK